MLKRMLHAANQVVTHPETFNGTELELSGTVNDAVDLLKVCGRSEQTVTVQGKNLIDCRQCSNPDFATEEGVVSGGGWAAEIFDRKWVIRNLKPSTTYYGKMTITMIEKVAGKKIFSLSKYCLLHCRSNTSININMFGRCDVELENGESMDISNTFTTPDDLTDLVVLAYTERYVDEDGKNAYYSNVTFSNIMLSEVDALYEPFVPNSPSPEYPQEIVSVVNPAVLSLGSIRGTTTTFPATLRSLPDGTRDCLVVDREAKRCWVERKVGELQVRSNLCEKIIFAPDLYDTGSSTNVGMVIKNLSSVTSYIGLCNTLKHEPQIWWKYNMVGYCFNGEQIHMKLPNSILGISDSAEHDAKKQAWIDYVDGLYDAGTPIVVCYPLASPVTEEIPWRDDYLLLTNQYYTRIYTDGEIHPDLEVTCKILGSR